jgi:hypothetical protein
MKLTRRKLLAATASMSTAGVGLTLSQGLDAATSGNVSVESEQAFVVTDVEVDLTPTRFTRISDDETSFQAAVEVVNGAEFDIIPYIKNASSNSLAAELKFSAANGVTITDIERENGAVQEAVQTGDSTWITEIGGSTTASPTLHFTVADTASPGSRDIEASVRPLSTND